MDVAWPEFKSVDSRDWALPEVAMQGAVECHT